MVHCPHIASLKHQMSILLVIFFDKSKKVCDNIQFDSTLFFLKLNPRIEFLSYHNFVSLLIYLFIFITPIT